MVIGSAISLGIGLILIIVYHFLFRSSDQYFGIGALIYALSNVLAAHLETMLVENELAIDYKIQTVSETVALTFGTLG